MPPLGWLGAARQDGPPRNLVPPRGVGRLARNSSCRRRMERHRQARERISALMPGLASGHHYDTATPQTSRGPITTHAATSPPSSPASPTHQPTSLSSPSLPSSPNPPASPTTSPPSSPNHRLPQPTQFLSPLDSPSRTTTMRPHSQQPHPKLSREPTPHRSRGGRVIGVVDHRSTGSTSRRARRDRPRPGGLGPAGRPT